MIFYRLMLFEYHYSGHEMHKKHHIVTVSRRYDVLYGFHFHITLQL